MAAAIDIAPATPAIRMTLQSGMVCLCQDEAGTLDQLKSLRCAHGKSKD